MSPDSYAPWLRRISQGQNTAALLTGGRAENRTKNAFLMLSCLQLAGMIERCRDDHNRYALTWYGREFLRTGKL